jgi:hypothetical protein
MALEQTPPDFNVNRNNPPAGAGHPTVTLDAGRVEALEFAPGETHSSRFRVLEPLGRGGMGAVFLVEDALTGETKALKAIPFKSISDLPDLSRELKAAHAVTGAGVVRYFDLFVDEGRGCLFITMERVEGETLESALARKPFTPAEALRFLRQAAAVLREIHAAGIVHQDLKPSNIFLLPDGGVKLGDFGISRFVDQEHGRISGTPRYMAPEQRNRSKPVTGKADWYALGLVLCEALTGDHSGAGMTPVDRRPARPEGPVAWERLPRSLRGLIRRLLEEEPEARWGDREVERHLRRRAILRTAAAAALALAILVPAGAFALRHFAEQPVEAVAAGGVLSVRGATRPLWSKTFSSPISQTAVEDLDGDGDMEVMAGMRLRGWDALRSEPFLRLFDGRGAELAAYPLPANLGRHPLREEWRPFPPEYFTLTSTGDLDGDGVREWVARLQNDPYYPCVTLFPPPKGAQGYNPVGLCAITHCGALEFIGIWRGKMVFCGWNNHWLHSQAVLVADPRRIQGSGISSVPGFSTTMGMEAYHLIGDTDIVMPRGAARGDRFALETSWGEVLHRLDPGFGLEGQPPGAAEASVALIREDLNVFHQLLGMGNGEGAMERAGRAMARARALKLAGHVSLFAWCRSKAAMAMGRTDEALATLDEGIAANPALQVGLRLWKTLDALLAGDPERALALGERLTHETCGWRAVDIEQLKAWMRVVSGRAPGTEGTAAWPAESDAAAYTRLQEGWLVLLAGRAEEALGRFARDLDRPRMEEHAAGLLLTERLAQRVLPEEPRILARCEAEPDLLRLARAVRAGDRTGAERAWDAIRADRLHTANSAVFYCLLREMGKRFPEVLGWIR